MPFGGLGTALSIGGSFLGSLFGQNKPKTTVTTPTFSAAQTNVQNDMAGALENALTNSTGMFQSQKNAAIGQTNESYNDASTSLENSLTARGFGGSGKAATNLQKLALGRAGAVSALTPAYDQMQNNYNLQVMGLANQFGFADPGSTSTVSGGQPSAIGAGIGGATQTATFLYALNHFLGGGGSGGSGGGGFPLDRQVDTGGGGSGYSGAYDGSEGGV